MTTCSLAVTGDGSIGFQRALHCVSKKVSTFKLSVTLSNVGKCMKSAAKSVQQYPSYLKHVATLPWEIKNSNFLQIFNRYGNKCLANAKRPCDCRVLCLRLKSPLCSCAQSISDLTSFSCRDQGRDSVCPVLWMSTWRNSKSAGKRRE